MDCVEGCKRDSCAGTVVDDDAHSLMNQVGLCEEHFARDHFCELTKLARRQPHFHAGRAKVDEVCEIIRKKLHSNQTVLCVTCSVTGGNKRFHL